MRPSRRSAAAERLAPLLPTKILLALAQVLDELCSDDSRKRVRAKLAALSRKPELALRSIGRRDLVLASEDGREDVRVAALCTLMCLEDDSSGDLFVAAMRTAIIDDALSFPRREITRAVRRVARRLNCKSNENSPLTHVDVVVRLCDVALEGLIGDDAQQLSACEIFAALVEYVPPLSAVWRRFTQTGLLIDSMLRSRWDRVRRVVYDVLNIIVDSHPLEGIPVLVSGIINRLRGPDYSARDAAAKLAALLARSSVKVPHQQEHDDEDTAFWRRAISLLKPGELELAICERYLLVSNVGESEAAPGALLVVAALAGRSPIAADRVLDVVRRVLAITRDSLPANDDTSGARAENETTMSAREQRGWHLCRGACICVKVYAFRASMEAVAACGESLLEDVLLRTRHSGAIAAAQSSFQVVVAASDASRRERWTSRCETLCDERNDRCASRRSAGLASAVVALIEATEDSSIVERLLRHLDELATSSKTANLRIMHCLAAAVWRCSRVPEPLYARALAAALVRADDASWSVRSASAMLVAAVLRKCSAGTARETSSTSRVTMATTTNYSLDEGDDTDTGVFARFVGLGDTLRDALTHSGRVALFASLNGLARFGQDAKRESRLKLAKTLVDSCLAHPCLSIRTEAAAALATALYREDLFAAELVSRGLNSEDGPNATHGALLACRRLVDAGAGPATKCAVARAVLQLLLLPQLPPISMLEAAAAAAKCADVCDCALSASLSAALEDAYAAALASTRLGCGCDAAPGESFARAELCASAAAARLREPPNARRLSEVLELLVGPDDECAMAITRSAIAFVTTKHLPLDAADDLDIEDVPIHDGDSHINPMLVETSAQALLHCRKSAPSRRAAALRLALRCASCVVAHTDSKVVDQRLRCHEEAGFPDFQAVAMQLRAVWWSEQDDCALLAEQIANAAHDETSPVLVRRGAARALALQPKLLMLLDASVADLFLMAALKLVVSTDIETRTAAARALALYCNPERPRGDPRDAGPLAPHAALRSAVLTRQRRKGGVSAELEAILNAVSLGGTSTTGRRVLAAEQVSGQLARWSETRGLVARR